MALPYLEWLPLPRFIGTLKEDRGMSVTITEYPSTLNSTWQVMDDPYIQ